MVYIASWQEYQEAAEALYEKSPNSTRYCVKWKSSEGKLVLKITDNTQCIKFKTYSSIFLNRFETLNLSLIQKMQNKRPQSSTTPAQPSRAETPAENISVSTPIVAVPSAAGGPTTGGIKKKKPKKKK